jgi:putative transposase
LIYSTLGRQQVLTDSVREALHSYSATVLKANGAHPVLINSVEDHIHLLFDLGRTAALSKVVAEVKAGSSRWIKSQGYEFSQFAWQAGYGAFAVEANSLGRMCEYIENQREHHKVVSFQDEYRKFLSENGIAFDERFVWE